MGVVSEHDDLVLPDLDVNGLLTSDIYDYILERRIPGPGYELALL